jgi:hypothetical protein
MTDDTELVETVDAEPESLPDVKSDPVPSAPLEDPESEVAAGSEPA